MNHTPSYRAYLRSLALEFECISDRSPREEKQLQAIRAELDTTPSAPHTTARTTARNATWAD